MQESVQCLAPDAVVEVAKRLDSLDWSWTSDELGSVLRAVGLTALDPFDSPSVRIEHPDLPDVVGFVVNLVDESMVLEISVTITALIDSEDQNAVATLSAGYEEYDAALKTVFGNPDDRPAAQGAVWDRGEEVLELRHLSITLALVRANKRSRKKRQGG